MSILQKVKSRKIAFLYYYQHHFVSEIDRYDISETISQEPLMELFVMQNLLDQQNSDPVTYIAQSQLGYTIEHYDHVLAQTLIDAYPNYAEQMSSLTQSYTKTFAYTEMSTIDQALIHLGYTEYMILHTPYKVVIDQMVEIAKRYSTPSSAKLINGILHAMLSQCTS